jgi:Fe-S cluster assembly ATP-binding protein
LLPLVFRTILNNADITNLPHSMLSIKGLHATIEGKEILKGLDLEVKAGEVHAIMGPNGSGKSTLANVLAGRSEYEVTGGNVSYFGKDLLALPPEERAWKGIFLAFQYPVEIPGVSNMNFLRTALNEKRRQTAKRNSAARIFWRLSANVPSWWRWTPR